MTKHSKKQDHLTPEMEDRVRERAYFLWEEAGRPDGAHDLHWHRAVEIITAETAAPDYLRRQDKPEETRLRAVETEKPITGRKVA